MFLEFLTKINSIREYLRLTILTERVYLDVSDSDVLEDKRLKHKTLLQSDLNIPYIYAQN